MPDVAVTSEARRAHLKTLSAVLIAEGETLRDLMKATSKARATPVRNADDARAVARSASNAIGDTLLETNARSRSAGLATLRDEYTIARRQAVGAGVDPFSMPPQIPASRAHDDEAKAREVAQQAHADMLRQATKILANAERAKNAYGSDILPKYALESIAATETVNRFHDERRRAAKQVAERYKGSNWLPAMLMMHDATLDVRTCSVCYGLNGKIRPLGLDFGKQLPIHRRCRCARVLIFVLAFLGRKEVDQAA